MRLEVKKGIYTAIQTTVYGFTGVYIYEGERFLVHLTLNEPAKKKELIRYIDHIIERRANYGKESNNI